MIQTNTFMLVLLIFVQSSIVVFAMDDDKLLKASLNRRLLQVAPTGTPLQLQGLIAAGADIDFREYQPCFSTRHSPKHPGKAALHIAIVEGNTTGALYLLSVDPDVQRKDNSGNSPLHLAAEMHAPQQLIRALCKRNAKLECNNNADETPLACAFKEKNPLAIKELIEAGASTKIEVPFTHIGNVAWSWQNCTLVKPFFVQLKEIPKDISLYAVTATTPAEVKHLLISYIILRKRTLMATVKPVCLLILHELERDIIASKLAFARMYLSAECKNEEVIQLIAQSIKDTLKKLPPLDNKLLE